jgi:hypothetical protein
MSPDYPNLDDRLAALTKGRDDCLYYAIIPTADDDLKVTFGTQTQWVGWADPQMRHELRKARLVYPRFVVLWQALRQPYAFIHTIDELTLYLVGGGNSLVEKNLAEQILGEMLTPEVSIPHGPVGFLGREMFEPTAFRRAPTPKIRMQVFKRDDYRCRICGRCPDDNSDLILHVHHIRPWARGGVTDPTNLITLCHTCHIGLVPHEDHKLFGLVPHEDRKLLRYTSTEPKNADSRMLEFLKGVANYRKVGFFESCDQPSRKG